MLPFFTNPYPDELLYSAIARYHFYSGNLDCKDTLEELLGSSFVLPSVEIGSHFSILARKLGPHYTIVGLFANHTIYSYYAMFLSEERPENSFMHPEIVQTEKSGEAKKYTLHSKSGNGIQQNELTLDEEVEGKIDNFELIEMDNQVHEYLKLPKVTKIRRNSSKQRSYEDENTK
ncbi:hypothetical protein [Bacillus smithii]|uniref:hypothetical protein n=1 Tax=Bacillus smithii TaxID=1479 RepID=UPI002E1EFDB2|nr:hypothetical protein [Bacillus smithii]